MFDTDQVLPLIADRIAQGQSLESICRELPGMPSTRSVRRWVDENPSILAEYARARAIGHDVIAERTRQVARGNVEAGSSGDVQRDRLIVETDLKLLACWDPKRYGAKVQLDADVRMQVELVDATAVQATATLITKEDPSTER